MDHRPVKKREEEAQGLLRYIPSLVSNRSIERSLDSMPTSAVNLRDVGAVDIKILKQGCLFRSSELFSAAEMERSKIKTILDLRRMDRPCQKRSRGRSMRTEDEALTPAIQPSVRHACAPCISLGQIHRHRQKPTTSCQTCQKEMLRKYNSGITIIHADLIPSKVGLRIFRALPFSVQFNALVAVCFGRGADSVLAPAVADDQVLGYKALYRTLLEESKTGMAIAFETLANPHHYPILVHCVHGKDRTGLIVMLLLMLIGVDREVILDDYTTSERVLKQSRLDKELHLRDFLTTDRVISANRDTLNDAMSFIYNTYGDAAGYLMHVGLDRGQLDRIVANIVQDGH